MTWCLARCLQQWFIPVTHAPSCLSPVSKKKTAMHHSSLFFFLCHCHHRLATRLALFHDAKCLFDGIQITHLATRILIQDDLELVLLHQLDKCRQGTRVLDISRFRRQATVRDQGTADARPREKLFSALKWRYSISLSVSLTMVGCKSRIAVFQF